MYQIPRIYNLVDTYHFVVGPLISAGDAVTPVTGFSDSDIDSFSLFAPNGQKISILPDVGWWSFLAEKGNGYYDMNFLSDAISANGSYKVSIQAAGKILPYNMDLMILHPDTYDELINGPVGSNAEITQILQQVSGSSNISTQLSAVEAKIDTANSAITIGFASTDVNIQSVSALDLTIKADTEEILASVTSIGSISADIISGGVLKQAGTTIKDIEVRDDEVFVSYRDTDGKLKTFSQPFTQDVIIASGGDLT